MSTPFLPSTLPLLPVPGPQLLFPFLSANITLNSAQVTVVVISITDNAKKHKLDDQTGGADARLVAVVPVLEIERRVGRWDCGESPAAAWTSSLISAAARVQKMAGLMTPIHTQSRSRVSLGFDCRDPCRPSCRSCQRSL